MYKWIIYKTTCQANGKIYIGQHKTKNIDDGYLGSGKLIRRAIEKYGLDNFTRDIFDVVDCREDASILEEAYIAKFDSTNPKIGYNITKLAWGGQPQTKETREKISKALSGKPKSEEFKQNLRRPKPPRTKEHSENISKAHSGKVWYNNPSTNESRQYNVNEVIPDNWIRGRGKTQKTGIDRKKKIYTADGKQAIISAAKSESRRSKISEKLMRHFVSEETRLKIGNSLRKYYEKDGINSDD